MSVAKENKVVHGNDLVVIGQEIKEALATKQDKLVSGTNIKTVNNTSLLGSGNVAVQPTLVSGTNIKTINNTSLLGSGDIVIPKGDKGDKGDTGDTGPQGPQGPQGNTGSSVDYPFELVNNLTTDDPTKALSAAQGVVLNSLISSVQGFVELSFSFTEEDGLFVIDKDSNIGIMITEDSIKVSDVINTVLHQLKFTNEDGFFLIDNEYNIGFKVNENGVSVIGNTGGSGAAVVNDSIPAPQTLIRIDYTTDSELPSAKGTVINGNVRINFDGFVLEKYSTLEVQGKSSASKPKKNFTFGLFNDSSYSDEYKLRIGNMVPHSEFVYKANYGDAAQVRNVGCNQLWEQVTMAHDYPPYRGNEGVYPYDTGALCHVNGYPCVLYVNNEFYGIGWWNIGKKRDNYDHNKSNQDHIQLQCQPRANLMGTFSETYWEIRNPKNPDSNFEGKVNAWFTDNARTGDAFKEHFGDHHNVRNNLDYFIFIEFVYDDDGLDNNIMLTTWDGSDFWMLPYDIDSSLGLSYDGSYITPYNSSVTESSIGGNVMNSSTRTFWRKFRDAYKTELGQRYQELKELGIFTVENVNRIISTAQKKYGPDNYALEAAKWPAIPSLNITSKMQILNWVRNRIEWMDSYYLNN